MTQASYEQSSQELLLPPEITTFVDNLDYDDEPECPHSVIEFKLAYGTADKEALLVQARENLSTVAEAYDKHLIGMFSGGIVDEQERVQGERAATDVRGWLSLVHQYDPEYAGNVVAQLSEAFLADYGNAPDEGYALWEVNSQTKNILSYNTDPEVARAFEASPLFTQYGADTDHIELQTQIAKLEGHGWDIRRQHSYWDVEETVEALLRSGINPHLLRTPLALIAERNPQSIPSIARAASDRTAREDLLLPSHRHQSQQDKFLVAGAEAILALGAPREWAEQCKNGLALQFIESKLYRNVYAYSDVLEAYRTRDGQIDPERVRILESILRRTPDIEPRRAAYPATLIATYAPAEDLVRLATESSSHIRNSSVAKNVIVRRLAQQGVLGQALDIAHTEADMPDAQSFVFDPIRNLLSIYEETGYEPALEEAQANIAQYKQSAMFKYHPHPSNVHGPVDTLDQRERAAEEEYIVLHEFAARRYAAFRKLGYEDRASAALGDMEVGHRNWDTHYRRKALELTMQMCMDMGEIELAEQYAEQYVGDVNIQDAVAENNDCLVAVAQAYTLGGRPQDAARVIAKHFFGDDMLKTNGIRGAHNTLRVALDPKLLRYGMVGPHIDSLHPNTLKRLYGNKVTTI